MAQSLGHRPSALSHVLERAVILSANGVLGSLGGLLLDYRNIVQVLGGLLIIFWLVHHGCRQAHFFGSLYSTTNRAQAYGRVKLRFCGHRICSRLDTVCWPNSGINIGFGGLHGSSENRDLIVVELFPWAWHPFFSFGNCD